MLVNAIKEVKLIWRKSNWFFPAYITEAFDIMITGILGTGILASGDGKYSTSYWSLSCTDISVSTGGVSHHIVFYTLHQLLMPVTSTGTKELLAVIGKVWGISSQEWPRSNFPLHLQHIVKHSSQTDQHKHLLSKLPYYEPRPLNPKSNTITVRSPHFYSVHIHHL